MKPNNLSVIIMAGGKGTRMKSELPKVLHKLGGQPLLSYSLDLAKELEAHNIIIIVGYKADQVRQAYAARPELTFALQEPQLGTGHAVMMAAPFLEKSSGPVLILSGDVPGLKLATLQNMLDRHIKHGHDLTVLAMQPDDPAAYGRLVTDGERLLRIVEYRDASAEERNIRLVNAGIYLVQAPALLAGLPTLNTNNDQQEYYITDLVEIMNHSNYKVGYALCSDPMEVAGVNSQEELKALEQILKGVN